jgi:tight adherence protein B
MPAAGMNGIAAAGLLLALALLVFPSSPRRRLAAATPSWGRVTVGTSGAGCLTACAAVAAATLLPLTTVLAAAMVAATASLRYRRRRRIRRATEEGRTLEAALDVLVGELRVGSHPVHAFGVAADETVGVVAMSLRAVAARARLGADVAAGLRAAARSSAQPTHWHRLAVCWQLASDHGLAIAGLMRTAQRDIVEHQRFSARVTAGMAGARATAAILAGLPVLGVLLGQLIGARPLSFLLSGHTGGWLLVVGSMLACGGLLWSDRIIERAGVES